MIHQGSQPGLPRRFPLPIGIAYHGILIGTTVIGAAVYAAAYWEWLGLRGRDLPEPFGEIFTLNPWVIFPAIVATLVFCGYWLLRLLPTEVVIGEGEIELRCPLQHGRWTAGQPLLVSIALLWVWVKVADDLYLLPRIYLDYDELVAALRERATPPPESEE